MRENLCAQEKRHKAESETSLPNNVDLFSTVRVQIILRNLFAESKSFEMRLRDSKRSYFSHNERMYFGD